MTDQKNEKPAAEETANGLRNIDRLCGAILPKNIKSKTQRQIQKPFEVYRLPRAKHSTRGGR
jgi:hypothetical protein